MECGTRTTWYTKCCQEMGSFLIDIHICIQIEKDGIIPTYICFFPYFVAKFSLFFLLFYFNIFFKLDEV